MALQASRVSWLRRWNCSRWLPPASWTRHGSNSKAGWSRDFKFSVHTFSTESTLPQKHATGPGATSVVNLEQVAEDAMATVRGWVRSVRIQKKVAFLTLNDGSCRRNVQVVSEPDELKGVTIGSSVVVQGTVKSIDGKKGDTIRKELLLNSVQIVGECDSSLYPLQKKAHSLEFLRDIMHLRSRSNTISSMLRVRNSLSNALHEFFQGNGFIHVHTPIITSNDCEGAGEMFSLSVDQRSTDDPVGAFFDSPAYLTVSGQLHAEIFALSQSKVYTFGPTFRAENSNTSRHLSEFWMVEPEIAFASLEDSLQNAEECLKFALKKTLDECTDDLEFFESKYDANLFNRLRQTVDATFGIITYTEAIKILQEKVNTSEITFDKKPQWGEPLATEHEKFLSEEYVGRPVFVINYPAKCKPFYMLRNDVHDTWYLEKDNGPQDKHTVACMDLLVPRLAELIGGSAREHRFEVLKQVMKRQGLVDPNYGKKSPPATSKGLEWYLDLRRFGTVPHAGWGMGFERLVQYTTGLENIRDVIPVPRVPGSCRF